MKVERPQVPIVVLKMVSAYPDILSYCVGTSELRLKLSTLSLGLSQYLHMLVHGASFEVKHCLQFQFKV